MSLLHGILKRLMTLQEDHQNNEPKQRFFEKNGEKKCSVKYFDNTKMFELEVYQPGEKPKTYQFDNIDMVAIDVFEIMTAED
ncbi:YkuJ family protein [Calidifontibacillus erzurumensis]|uniref:YkuJ family protein n=1 Tax=Calidifontibacillus erzurumensis TaxID=2741433 RepID=A0A8J8GE35_9BACI|nr:YkuJ family protein [Calidifontibacillus erzurumensis]NSL50703.1 YkuJ family protein [Calidifontibacillus erzurumensis]